MQKNRIVHYLNILKVNVYNRSTTRNKLDNQNELQNLTKEKLITTKELAQVLGVSVDTIANAVKKLFNPSELNRRVINGGNSFIFNQTQATAIKIELQNHSKIASNGYDTLTISNDIEMLLLQKKLDEYKDNRIKELTLENQCQKNQLIEQKPKVEYFDNVYNSENLVDIGTVGKNIGIGAKNIFKFLIADKIIYEKYTDGIKYYLPYRDYEKYFKSIQKPFELNGIKKFRYQLFFNSKGIIWANRKYKEL